MTTKMDLLKDNLIDLLKNYELVSSDEQMYNVVEQILDVLTNNDIDDVDATNMDFKIEVINKGVK